MIVPRAWGLPGSPRWTTAWREPMFSGASDDATKIMNDDNGKWKQAQGGMFGPSMNFYSKHKLDGIMQDTHLKGNLFVKLRKKLSTYWPCNSVFNHQT